MSDNKVQMGGGGIGCFTILGIIFITLKLAEVGQVAKWSWWWVLSPFWIPVVLGISVFLILVLGGFIVLYLKDRR